MEQTAGYRKKPFWIVATAILLFVTPYFHLMWILKSAGETAWYSPIAMWKWIPHLHPAPAVISALLILGGFSLLYVKKWSWWIGMFSLTCLSIYNISIIQNYYSDDPSAAVIGTGASLLLLFLLFASDFKKPFFNQRLRWWESDPRYKVNVPIQIKGQEEKSIVLMDISKTGILLEPTNGAEIDFPPEVDVIINAELEIPCVYSRRTENGAAYRIKNVTRFQSKYLRNWLNLLAKEPERFLR